MKKPKPIVPRLRGEVWKLRDGREVTVLRHLTSDCLSVINERGIMEAVYVPQFQTRIMPPVVE